MGFSVIRLFVVLFFTTVLLSPVSTAAQTASAPPSPQELVRRAVTNEEHPPDADKKYMFQQYKKHPGSTQTILYVQTREAIAGLMVAIDDKPLTDDQRKSENQRVQRFINDPEELKKKQVQEKENTERISKIIRALPTAFLYQADGTELGRSGVGRPGEELTRLSFQPNPKYDPPTREEQILTGMQGHILIDAKTNRIARIEGTLQKDVGFGWGILGHLDRGGHILIEQGNVCDQHWQITTIDTSFTGKILLFKSLNIQSRETYSNFHAVPSDLSFAQGVDMLRKQENAMSSGTK